ncbi:50S ribosomal protein L23 [Chromatiales bacterium (ex Bugula neritina AB1)]|nr:50S ribosomal protein L23 [Chromatiales bacterium (ex Bugula neritina AB1)]
MNEERIYSVILAPHVSEKSAMQAELSGQHTFKVVPDATKLEVKKAVEKLFKVTVVSVRMSNTKGKVKRQGARLGRRSDMRKAIVRLAEGQDIDYMGLEG